MAYATSTDLNDTLGYTPDNATVLLDRASRQIDRAIQCAVYDVDDNGDPTDATITAALLAATVEQVCYQLDIGNKTGISHGLQAGVPSSTSAGEVALSRGQSAGGSSADMPWLAEQAAWILREAGLIGQEPQVGDVSSAYVWVSA